MIWKKPFRIVYFFIRYVEKKVQCDCLVIFSNNNQNDHNDDDNDNN